MQGQVTKLPAIFGFLPPVQKLSKNPDMVCQPYIFENCNAFEMLHTARYSHITPVIIDLHWLPVEFRIITFKALHDLAPPYLSDMKYYKAHLRYLRCNDSNMLVRPAIRSARRTGGRAFSVAAPALWNT